MTALTVRPGPPAVPAAVPPDVPPDVPPSVADLVDGAKRGDPHAWAELFARYNRYVVGTARRCGLSPEESDDVAQTTWLSLYRSVGSVRSGEALQGWLTTTAVREAIVVSRRRRRELPDTEYVARHGGAWHDDPDGALDSARLVEHLRGSIARLPRRERALVTQLLRPDRPSYQQVSRELAMPVGSIGPVRQRALQRLRALLWSHRDLL